MWVCPLETRQTPGHLQSTVCCCICCNDQALKKIIRRKRIQLLLTLKATQRQPRTLPIRERVNTDEGESSNIYKVHKQFHDDKRCLRQRASANVRVNHLKDIYKT